MWDVTCLPSGNETSLSVAVEPLNMRVPSSTERLKRIHTGLGQAILGRVAHLDTGSKVPEVKRINLAADAAINLSLNHKITSDVVAELLRRIGRGRNDALLATMWVLT